MADEQTSDFFLPPATSEEQTFDYNYDSGYAQPPEADTTPVVVEDEYEAPPPTSDGDVIFMEPVVVEEVPVEDVPIVLMPPPVVEGSEEVTTTDLVDSKSAMTAFMEEFQETLKARKEEENRAKSEAIAQAEQDLKLIAQQREMKREAKMSKNRSEEQSKLEAMEADLENDNSWQRVVKLVDLTQDGRDGAEDTKRMRDVFIVLKNDTNKALQLC